MNAKEFLNDVCKEIKYKPANKPVSEELEGHIQDAKADYLCKGYSEKEAEEKAVEQMGDAKQIGRKLNKIHKPKLDWKLLVLILVLMVFNIITNTEARYKRKVIYILIGIVLGIAIYFFDYRKIKKYSNLMYLSATLIILFQVFDNFVLWNITGIFINMRLWNVAIPLYIIAFAGYIVDYKKEDFWDMVILYSISLFFIYYRSGSITNTAILLLAYLTIIFVKMLQTNKYNIKKIIVICGSAFLIYLIIMILMTNIKIKYFNFGDTPEYYWNLQNNSMQDRISEILENSKLIGKANIAKSSNNVLYECKYSSFQFIYILGNFGIIPAIMLALAIILMCIKLIKNSKVIEDLYGKYLIIGLSITYIVQSIIHILMNLNIWIISDINLPFVSNGNLYFLINSFTFAIILSVYRRKDINFEEPKKSKIAAKVENFFFEEY